MCTYTVESSEANGSPIPSPFSDEVWTFGAFHNEDFNANSTISGTHSKHYTYTAQVLYQETPAKAKLKQSIMKHKPLKKNCIPHKKNFLVKLHLPTTNMQLNLPCQPKLIW